MYQLLVYVHVVSAVIWVGGAVFGQVFALVVMRGGDPAELPLLGRRFERVGNLLFMPAAVLILLSGAAMVVQAWRFDQAWIALAIALWVVSAAAGALYVAPRIKRAGELFKAEGAESPVARQQIARVFLVTRLELVSFAVILALMVWKPGT